MKLRIFLGLVFLAICLLALGRILVRSTRTAVEVFLLPARPQSTRAARRIPQAAGSR